MTNVRHSHAGSDRLLPARRVRHGARPARRSRAGALRAAVDAGVARRIRLDTRQLAEKSRYEQSFIQCQNLWEDCRRSPPNLPPGVTHTRRESSAWTPPALARSGALQGGGRARRTRIRTSRTGRWSRPTPSRRGSRSTARPSRAEPWAMCGAIELGIRQFVKILSSREDAIDGRPEDQRHPPV